MSPKGDFQVFIYESEYRKIQAWVDKYQHLETGGDLFGLWADDRTAVVQLVLGPGEHCRRTPVSFYQDVDYLDRVGNRLTNEEGLCHIGEWHSHHRLGLSKPSGGDENTVWTNMDRYDIHRFFLFIATINSSWPRKVSKQDAVAVNCFLFEVNRDKRILRQGYFTRIQEQSPLLLKYNDDINNGAESVIIEHESSSEYRQGNSTRNQEQSSILLEGNDEINNGTEGVNDVRENAICVYILSICSRISSWGNEKLEDDKEVAKTFSFERCLRGFIHLCCCPICWFIPAKSDK